MIMPVDVVLPCAPATETSRCPEMSHASACERCSTGSPRSRASWYSGLSCQSAPGHDDRLGVADVGGVVADRDLGAERAQRRDVRGVAHVGAGHPVPRIDEEPCDAAHARTADADEVHGAELGGDLGGEVGLDGHVGRSSSGAVSCGSRVVGESEFVDRADAATSAHSNVTRLSTRSSAALAERGVDERHHAVGAVEQAGGCRSARHRGDARPVGQERDELVAHPRGQEPRVVDE